MTKQILSINEIFSEFQIRELDLKIEYLKLKKDFEKMINEVQLLSEAQDFCDFNVFSIICIPAALSMETVKFMVKNKSEIKRKFKLKEAISLDSYIHIYNPNSFRELTNKLKGI